ncbi:MAG: hypothetical protein GXY85_12825 [Candidatus Brocadiaceae bacterium]|nr:hypothetical protein [Candidatus Brocadiaceae bacterium]
MVEEVSFSLKEAAHVARRSRNVFVGSMFLCCVLALFVTQVQDRPLGEFPSVHAVLGAFLLWALAAAAYAFHAARCAYGRIVQRMERVLADDEARAQMLVRRVKARLSPDATAPGQDASPC